MELVLQAYYNLLDNASHSKEWQRKIEEDLGQSIAYLAIGFDESVRDGLVAKSELFQRFVSQNENRRYKRGLTFVFRIMRSKSSSSEEKLIIIKHKINPHIAKI